MISSFCSGGDCVDVEFLPNDAVRVTSTREPTKDLIFTPAEWSTFLRGVRAGEFDLAVLP